MCAGAFFGHKTWITLMTACKAGKDISFFWKETTFGTFAFFAAAVLNVPMMKPAPNVTTDWNASAERLAGARILVMEKCFDALVDAMIEDGSEPVNAAVVMLEHLAERFAERRRGS